MWKRFNEFAISAKYRKDWLSLLSIIGIDGSQMPIAVIIQHVARVLLDDKLKMMAPHEQKEIDAVATELCSDEEEVIRYTCGYVVRSLKKKFTKKANFVAVLDVMHADEDDDDSDNFLEYTTKWLAMVDRGGLYKVNDETFLLFRCMELTMRKYLCGKSIEAITKILDSENVMACWSLICQSLTDDESDILLTKVAGLWLH